MIRNVFFHIFLTILVLLIRKFPLAEREIIVIILLFILMKNTYIFQVALIFNKHSMNCPEKLI